MASSLRYPAWCSSRARITRRMVSGAGSPECVYVVHGEQHAAAAFAGKVRDRFGWTAVVPRHEERVLLG